MFSLNQKFDIVMPVMNGIHGDSRVIKTAKSLQNAGYRVLVVGYIIKPPVLRGYVASEEFDFPCVFIRGFNANSGLFNGTKEEIRKRQIEQYSQELTNICIQTECKVLFTHDMGLIWAGSIVKKVLGLKWIHDLHEWVKGLTNIDEFVFSYSKDEEEKGINFADKLLTVSDSISAIYQEDYKLSEKPTVIYNAPYKFKKEPHPTIREDLGIDQDIPLGVYVGNVKPARGVDRFICALEGNKKLHLALVTNNKGAYLEKIINCAKKIGAENRLHIKPYVPVEILPHYISTASFGFHTMPKYGNGDVALPNKLFEYIQAGLPVAVSNATDMKNFVATNNCGVVFKNNPASIKKSVKKLLRDISNYVPNDKLKNEFNWENEEKKIIKIVGNFIKPTLTTFKTKTKDNGLERTSVLHGIAHSAGQPHILSEIINENSKKYSSKSLAIAAHKQGAKADIFLEDFTSQTNNEKIKIIENLARDHKIFHFHARSFFWSPPNFKEKFSDLAFLKSLDAKIVFNFRGSEIRNLRVFDQVNKFSYTSENPRNLQYKYSEYAQNIIKENIQKYSDLILVPDDELKFYVPEAKVLQRSVTYKFDSAYRTNKILRFLHAPTNQNIKGSDHIDNAFEKLRNEGFNFEYIKMVDVKHSEILEEIKKADVVIDQLRIGSYGVFSVEASSQSKPVICYINDHIQDPTKLPFINSNPDRIEKDLRKILKGKIDLKEVAQKTGSYFKKNHSHTSLSKKLDRFYDDVMCSKVEVDYKKALKELLRNINSLADSVNKQKTKIKSKPKTEKIIENINDHEAFEKIRKADWSAFNDEFSYKKSNHKIQLSENTKPIKNKIKRLNNLISNWGLINGTLKFITSRIATNIRKKNFSDLVKLLNLNGNSLVLDFGFAAKYSEITNDVLLPNLFQLDLENKAIFKNLNRLSENRYAKKINLRNCNRMNNYDYIFAVDEHVKQDAEQFSRSIEMLKVNGYVIVESSKIRDEEQIYGLKHIGHRKASLQGNFYYNFYRKLPKTAYKNNKIKQD